MNTQAAQVFIDGRFRRAHNVEPVVEAATEDPIGEGPSATIAEVDDAVTAARSGLRNWSMTPASERADVLDRLADGLDARTEFTAELCTREVGTPIGLSRPLHGMWPAAVLRHFAALIRNVEEEDVRPGDGGHTIVRRKPVGVVAAIVPWNGPQILAAIKFGAALAAGCTAVLKPASQSALDARVIGEAAAEAGLPDGVLNIVPGGYEAGAHLVRHPGVDKVSFTGSVEAGRLVGEACGRLVRPVTLELGGKSAAIILDDADMELVLQGLRFLSFGNNGQMCFANTRILAPRLRYRSIVEAIADMAESLVIGNPLDSTIEIGPLATSCQRDRVMAYVETGKGEGARLVTGGNVPSNQPRGWYVSPTVFADVNNSSRLAQEEIFGPVVCVIPYDSDDDAVAIANDSNYGLAGSVWSADEARALAVAEAVQTGSIGVNGYQFNWSAPFGGVKSSGFGRECGPEGLAGDQSVQSVWMSPVT